MKKTKFILSVVAVLWTAVAFTQESDVWLTNMDAAKKEAKESNRLILMSFQGSDWCGNCRRLEKQLFHDEAFQAYAKENYVLLKLDFPMRSENQLSKEQTAHNEALAEKYNADGKFPKVLVFNAQGEKLGAMEYPLTGAKEYIVSLDSYRQQ